MLKHLLRYEFKISVVTVYHNPMVRDGNTLNNIKLQKSLLYYVSDNIKSVCKYSNYYTVQQVVSFETDPNSNLR